MVKKSDVEHGDLVPLMRPGAVISLVLGSLFIPAVMFPIFVPPSTLTAVVWQAAFIVITGAALINALRITTAKAVVYADRITWRTWFSDREINWQDAQVVRAWLSVGQYDTLGLVSVESERHRIVLRLSPDAYPTWRDLIARRCVSAYLIDGDTGEVVGPEMGRSEHATLQLLVAQEVRRQRLALLGYTAMLGLVLSAIVYFVIRRPQNWQIGSVFTLVFGGVPVSLRIRGRLWRIRNAHRSLDTTIRPRDDKRVDTQD